MKAAFLLLFVAVALSSCGGAGGDLTTQGACTGLTAPAPPQLVYPEPGAVNVPDGNFTMVLSFGSGPVELSGADLQPAPVPNPLPSPHATPSPFSPSALTGWAVGSLSPHTTYAITYGIDSRCSPFYDLGEFTTR